ncbi:hypothetical protein H0H81_003513 [Sphagnurus paluster]|uniref:Uncharacterized protein n=1 Tax=Sphagnurus paluster TaxID=117069 RepID=A0A9P7FVZ7_9AGAR|nr:hypothetical protein H0H81_003513 [Sphagnurus paluster]
MPVGANKSGTIAEEMGLTIKALEESIQLLAHDIPPPSKKNHSLGKKSEKESNKDARFGLFKRSHYSPANEFGVESASDASENLPFQRVLSVLEVLKSQHATFVQTLSDVAHSTQGSPLPMTFEEDNRASSPYGTPMSRHSKRTSIATTISDSVNEWFDALDGAEEFIIDTDGTEAPSRMLTNESRSSLSHQDTSSTDTDMEEDDFGHKPSTPTNVVNHENFLIKRRTQLPSSPIGDEGSLFAILKKNVGKDLSTITFPVTFNEPLTLLQRAAEEVEYYSVLDEAANTDNPVDRICYVAAFAVSSYAHTRNPMLGETFEDPRMKFIAEKVRHNPLEMAYHAEGEKWQLNATSSGKTKFWGA